MCPRARVGSATSAPKPIATIAKRLLRVLAFPFMRCSFLPSVPPKFCKRRESTQGKTTMSQFSLVWSGEDALARRHLPRTRKAGVPAQGVTLGDRGRDPRPGGDPDLGRRADLAGRRRRRGACRGLSLRRVGDPCLSAAREAAAHPGQEGGDDGGPGPPRPPRGAE